MPTTYKVLGQVSPSASTDIDLYSVAAPTQAVISTISICNRANTDATYRIAVRPNGTAIASGGSISNNANYLVYDAIIPANTTTAYTMGLTLGGATGSDFVSVRSSNGSVSFQAYGSEIS